MTKNELTRALAAITVAALLAGCAGTAANASTEDSSATGATQGTVTIVEEAEQASEEADGTVSATEEAASTYEAKVTQVSGLSGILSAEDLFTDRDLTQTADLSGATYYTVSDGQDINITAEGVYVIQGTATNVTIRIEADDASKVQIVLDGVTITNDDASAIYVVSADKVFVTTTEGSQNTLSVTGTFSADGDTNTDAVIFSKDDLVLNGLGTLTISSTDNGISGKDDVKVTGGSYVIEAASKCIEANDSIRIADGTFTLVAGTDALHAEYDDDDAVGYIYIYGGTFDIDAGDDGIHATTYAQIDGGSFTVSAAEGIEATYVQVNGGTISISSWDDGINAAYKSTSLGTPTIDITGGDITIEMAQGDTDALDSNGNLYVSGGTIDITAQFAFDFDGQSSFTGGTIYVNGEQVTTITNSMMMGGGMGGQMGGMQGGQDGFGGGQGGPGGGMGGQGGGRPGGWN